MGVTTLDAGSITKAMTLLFHLFCSAVLSVGFSVFSVIRFSTPIKKAASFFRLLFSMALTDSLEFLS